MSRQFTSTPAKRSRVPLLIGIAGPSNSGKTFSALELATGIQTVTGGEIEVIDTEAGRALHYAHDEQCGHFNGGKCSRADHFTFRHMPFAPPFGCLDYLDAIRYSVERGNIPIIDSASHMHEGQGGMLDQHEDAIDRALGAQKDDYRKRLEASFRCWKEPKADMNRFVQCLLQLNATVIFCFRAKEKLKPGKDDRGEKALVNQGTMAIADDSLIYEMVVQPLLEAGARGVPNWNPSEKGSKLQTKLPSFFRDILTKPGQPLNRHMGELMGRWAVGAPLEAPAAAAGKRQEKAADPPPSGGNAPETALTPEAVTARVKAASTLGEVDAVSAAMRTVIGGWTTQEKDAVRETFRARRQELTG